MKGMFNIELIFATVLIILNMIGIGAIIAYFYELI